ncbi:MAG: hypothetical protein JJE22_09010, partial [Bacteroidia bacterium]|nr:hypothetical protein [Bacteroidia bacterium]
MKKPKNQNEIKTQISSNSLSATLEETYMLKYLVEKVASSRFDSGYNDKKVQTGWQAIETSSLEADVSGYINFSEKTDLINIPFENCFLFTCI